MATRLYLTADAAPVTPAEAVFDAAGTQVWESPATAPAANKLARAADWPGATTFATVTATNIATAAADVGLRIFVSDPLSGAQTITGTLQGQMKMRENNIGLNAHAQIMAKVVTNDGQTLRGTLYGGDSRTGTVDEFTTTLRNQQNPAAGAGTSGVVNVTSVSAQDGDRIVIEVGYRNNSTGTQIGELRFGSLAATGGANDYASAGTETTDLNGWVELSQTLTFAVGQVLAGYATSQATTRGTLSVSYALAGRGAGKASTSATESVSYPLAGSAAGKASARATVAFSFALVGRASGQASARAVESASYPLTGRSSGKVQARATQSVSYSLGGRASARASARATENVSYALLGRSTGKASTQAVLTFGAQLSGSARGKSSATASLVQGLFLLGSASSKASARGTLAVTAYALAGGARSRSRTSGTVALWLAGVARGRSEASASLTLPYVLLGRADGRSSARISSLPGTPEVVPESQTLYIFAENRILIVKREDRILVIPQENRLLTVEA